MLGATDVLLWHHILVIGTGVRLIWGVWAGLLLIGLGGGTPGPAQSKSASAQAQRARAAKRTAAAQTADEDRIAALVAKQTSAIQAGALPAIEEASRSLNAYTLREFAKLRVLEGNDHDAAALYQESLSAEDSPEVRLELASVLVRLGDGAAAEREHGAAQAVSALPAPKAPVVPSAGAGVLNAGSQDLAHSQAASLHDAQQKYLDAKEAKLRRILANSFNDLGTAEARQQQYKIALGNFQNAEHWQDPDPGLLRNIGVAAFRTQDYAEATRALGIYLQRASDEHLRLMLAMSQFSMGNFAQAATNFGQVSMLTLEDPRAAYSWAFSLARTGQQQRANEIAGQLTTLVLPPDAMYLVCHVYMDTEAYEQSLACLRKVAAADSTLRLVHYGEGESLIRLDRPAEAIPELREELALSPADPNVESSLAFALLQTSQKDEARQLLEEAVKVDPEHARAQYQLGKLLLDGGDASGAVPHLEVAERVDPSPDYVHYQLGTAYRKLGKAADAERELKIYREIKDKARAAATVPAAAVH